MNDYRHMNDYCAFFPIFWLQSDKYHSNLVLFEILEKAVSQTLTHLIDLASDSKKICYGRRSVQFVTQFCPFLLV